MLDNDFDGFESLYKTGAYLHPFLKESLDNAANLGTDLLSLQESHRFWFKTPKFSSKYFRSNKKEMYEFDMLYYVYRADYGWELPCKEHIDNILKFSQSKPILEIGCGTGFWSKILSHKTKVYPTDNYFEEGAWRKTWIDREQLDCKEAMEKYPDSFIFLWQNMQEDRLHCDLTRIKLKITLTLCYSHFNWNLNLEAIYSNNYLTPEMPNLLKEILGKIITGAQIQPANMEKICLENSSWYSETKKKFQYFK